MHSPTSKPLAASYPGVKVRRSEFEDGTMKSLVREGTRLGQQLKQYDRAKKVMRKELEYDRRQALKLSRKIRASDLLHMLSLHGDSGSDVEPKANQRNHVKTSSPWSPSIKPKNGHRAKTANASRKAHDSMAAQTEHSGDSKHSFGKKHQIHSKIHDEHFADSTECHGLPSTKRQTSRKKLFDDLSKPKNRSDILGVRQRLREEFGKPRPYSSNVASGHRLNPTSPRVVIHGSGPNAVAVLTTRSPTRTQTLSLKDKTCTDEVDGDGLMSPAELRVLLSSPTPVVVKRNPKER